jgi:hypothetical protein
MEAHRFVRRRLKDGGKIVSFTRRPPFTPRKIPGTNFCSRLCRPQGHNAAGRIKLIEKVHLIGNRTRDLQACSIVPQPTTLPLAPYLIVTAKNYPRYMHVCYTGRPILTYIWKDPANKKMDTRFGISNARKLGSLKTLVRKLFFLDFIGTSGVLLWTQQWPFGFCRRLEMS